MSLLLVCILHTLLKRQLKISLTVKKQFIIDFQDGGIYEYSTCR